MKKKWQKMLIPFIAILVIAVIAIRKPEGFQNANLAAVGFQFTGPLSAIHNTFTKSLLASGEPVPEYINKLMTNPVTILGPFLETYPALKYSIIQVSTGNTIYDPIAEYKKDKTMSPFPKTTNSDEYIIHSNLFNMPITKEQATQFYPLMAQNILSNCSVQDTRNNTEDLISSAKGFLSLALNNKVAMERNSGIQLIAMFILGNTFTSSISINPTTKRRPEDMAGDLFSSFTQEEQVAANAAGVAAAAYTGNPADLSTLTETQIQSYNTAVIAYLKSTKSYADAVIYVELINISQLLIPRMKTVTDHYISTFAIVEGITYKSTIYEPCVAFTSGFQNMEGFTVDKSQLYDYRGNKVFSAPAARPPAPPAPAPPAPAPPAAAPPAAKDEGMDGLTIGLIALGVPLVIAGGIFLVVNSSTPRVNT